MITLIRWLHWVDGYITYFNRFAEYRGSTMLVLDLSNLSDLSLYHERTKIFVIQERVFVIIVIIARLCLVFPAGSKKITIYFFQNFSYYDVPLRDLKNLEIRGREIIINFFNIMQP